MLLGKVLLARGTVYLRVVDRRSFRLLSTSNVFQWSVSGIILFLLFISHIFIRWQAKKASGVIRGLPETFLAGETRSLNESKNHLLS